MKQRRLLVLCLQAGLLAGLLAAGCSNPQGPGGSGSGPAPSAWPMFGRNPRRSGRSQ